MAEANGTVAIRDPDALVNEIERTRHDLARTIDALAERTSPASVARREAARLRELARPEVRLAGAAVAAAIALGAAVYLVRRRHR